jgi:hypothetical protein
MKKILLKIKNVFYKEKILDQDEWHFIEKVLSWYEILFIGIGYKENELYKNFWRAKRRMACNIKHNANNSKKKTNKT